MRTYKVIFSTTEGVEEGAYLSAENSTKAIQRAIDEYPELDEIIEVIPMPRTAS